MPRLESAPPFRFSHEVPMTGTRLVATQEDDMKEINKYALKEMTREEVAIFRLDLVNDKVDRHFSRFPEKELRRINRLIVGKPLMELHQTNTRQARGLFFRSNLATDNGISVRPDAYVPRTYANRELIDNIMAGIYRGTSIGFQFEYPECSICSEDLRTCAHMPGSEYEVERGSKKQKEVCHYVMHDVSDVFEGSIVPVPSQRTEIIEARALGVIGEEGPIYQGVHGLYPFDKALATARAAYRAPVDIESEDYRKATQELRVKLRAMN